MVLLGQTHVESSGGPSPSSSDHAHAHGDSHKHDHANDDARNPGLIRALALSCRCEVVGADAVDCVQRRQRWVCVEDRRGWLRRWTRADQRVIRWRRSCIHEHAVWNAVWPCAALAETLQFNKPPIVPAA